jgi:anti-sigma regulatory factor (Ser/Thr protein kinase)
VFKRRTRRQVELTAYSDHNGPVPVADLNIEVALHAAASLACFDHPTGGKPPVAGPNEASRERSTICTAQEHRPSSPFLHEARLYIDPGQLTREIDRFVGDGRAAGEPTLVLLPASRLEWMGRLLGDTDERVRLEDMSAVGRNPARILPALRDWVDRHHGPVRFATEPTWPGRTEPETAEVMLHEALVNLALADTEARLLCLYHEETLAPDVLEAAERTHQRIVGFDGAPYDSPRYGDPLATYHEVEQPLASPPGPVEEVPLTDDLQRVRERVATSSATAPLPAARREDFVLAVNEAATNALKYDRPPRAVRLWRSGASAVGEVVASGQIDDPLAGRRRPAATAPDGRGLWIINQLCDLVELRSRGLRTTLRMHMLCST